MKTYVLKGDGKYKCGEKGCKKRFSITTGTYFENTKLPLRKWLIAMYLCLNHKKGVSSLQLAETLGVTQKTAWFVLHRIRAIVTEQAPDMLLSGVVEADETYIGGKEKNKHQQKKTWGEARTSVEKRKEPSEWYNKKKIVVGAVERGGKVVAKHVETLKGNVQHEFIKDNVHRYSILCTDEHHGYTGLGKTYTHETIVHSAHEYVRGDVHTNTIENFWSVVKRCVNGTYHQLSEKHLQSYLDEFTFRYTTRELTGNAKFNKALEHCHGRLRYKDLITQ